MMMIAQILCTHTTMTRAMVLKMCSGREATAATATTIKQPVCYACDASALAAAAHHHRYIEFTSKAAA